MWVDSHCHLSFPDFKDNIPERLADMQAAQVDAAMVICTQLEGFEDVLALALAHNNLYATVGVHPDEKDCAEPTIADILSRAARSPKVLAIGETGLDYYWNKGEHASLAWQRERFARHIQAGIACNKPLVVHTRAASSDTIDLMRAESARTCGGVLHCFTESWEVAKAALDMGFYISFSGIVTFKTAQDIRDVALKVPLDRILVETDSPYLAPVPKRGKTNEPAFVAHVGRFLAELRGEDETTFAAATTQNFRDLFLARAGQ